MVCTCVQTCMCILHILCTHSRTCSLLASGMLAVDCTNPTVSFMRVVVARYSYILQPYYYVHDHVYDPIVSFQENCYVDPSASYMSTTSSFCLTAIHQLTVMHEMCHYSHENDCILCRAWIDTIIVPVVNPSRTSSLARSDSACTPQNPSYMCQLVRAKLCIFVKDMHDT